MTAEFVVGDKFLETVGLSSQLLDSLHNLLAAGSLEICLIIDHATHLLRLVNATPDEYGTLIATDLFIAFQTDKMLPDHLGRIICRIDIH